MDAIIIAFIIVAAAAAFIVFRSSGLFGADETVDIEYVIYISNQRSEIIEHLVPGGNVIEGSKKYIIGEAVDVSTEPYTEEVCSYVDNKLVISEVPGYYNAFITVRAKAVLGVDGYYINGYRINTGAYIYVRLPDFCGTGYVTGVETITP